MKFVGFLACAFMVIPSANAVDALKTCACLLKECRYDRILIGSSILRLPDGILFCFLSLIRLIIA